MHLTLWFDAENPLIHVPLSNLHLFQSLIYKILPESWASFLHGEGYVVDGKRMKLFAMSWPIASAKPSFTENSISFPVPLKLVISTPVTATLDGVAGGALGADEMRIGNNIVYCRRIEAAQHHVSGESVALKTLSPITCYGQADRGGKPYTIYFNPRQPDFSLSVHNNLVRKFRAFHPERAVPEGQVSIVPIGEPRERIATFSPKTPFPIKGWSGRFRLEGPQELLQMGVDCGLGAKNSGGWGCVEMG